MTQKKIENCAHCSFQYETVTASGVNVAIIRCSECGEAIGAFLPQLPDALNKLAQGLTTLYDEVKKLPH